ELPYLWDLEVPLKYTPPRDPKRDPPVDVKLPFRTDFASIPWIFTWLFPRYGRYTKAAIVHDYLCRTQPDKFASDRTIRLAMKDLRVRWATRSLIWSAVSLETMFAVAFLRRTWLSVVTVVALAVGGVLLALLTTLGVLGVTLVVVAGFLGCIGGICYLGSSHRPLLGIVFGTYLGLPGG